MKSQRKSDLFNASYSVNSATKNIELSAKKITDLKSQVITLYRIRKKPDAIISFIQFLRRAFQTKQCYTFFDSLTCFLKNRYKENPVRVVNYYIEKNISKNYANCFGFSIQEENLLTDVPPDESFYHTILFFLYDPISLIEFFFNDFTNILSFPTRRAVDLLSELDSENIEKINLLLKLLVSLNTDECARFLNQTLVSCKRLSPAKDNIRIYTSKKTGSAYLLSGEKTRGSISISKQQEKNDELLPNEFHLLEVFRALNTKNRMHVTSYAEIRLEEQAVQDSLSFKHKQQ